MRLGYTRDARDQAHSDLARVSRPDTLPIHYRFVCENLAGALVVRGEWDELDRLLDEVWATAPPPPREQGITWPWPGLHLQMHQQRANLARGRPLDSAILDYALEAWGRGWKAVYPGMGLAATLADVARAAEDLSRVRTLLEGAWSLPRPERLCADLPVAILAALRGETILADHQDATSSAASRKYVHKVMLTAQRLPRQGPRGEAWWLEARAHAARARGGDTPEQWAEAASAWAECERLPDVSGCLRHQGEAFLAGGDREAAETALQEAFRIATDVGAAPLAEEIAKLGRRARLQFAVTTTVPAATAAKDNGGLTPREHEVLKLLAEGKTNGQIGTSLYISPKTASIHVSRILMKLGAANRTEATTIARRRALIDP